jgi:hypothetical protein
MALTSLLVRYLKKKQQVGYNFFLEIVREIFGDALRNIFSLVQNLSAYIQGLQA